MCGKCVHRIPLARVFSCHMAELAPAPAAAAADAPAAAAVPAHVPVVLDTTEVSAVKSQRGHEKLCAAGYSYALKRVTNGAAKVYVCEKKTCLGRMVLVNGVYTWTVAHSHEPNPDKVARDAVLSKLKEGSKKI